MPTYQYACKNCGHHLEVVQSFSDASLTECPECSGQLRKVFNSVGVVFKGSGFYRNDSRSGTSSSIPSESSSGSPADGGTSGSDSKPSGTTPAPSSAASSSTSSTSSSSSSSSSE